MNSQLLKFKSEKLKIGDLVYFTTSSFYYGSYNSFNFICKSREIRNLCIWYNKKFKRWEYNVYNCENKTTKEFIKI